MFSITFETETYQQWSSDFLFKTFGEAKTYLLQNGFIEKNRIFERKNYRWITYQKAYIKPMKIYSFSDNKEKVGLEQYKVGSLYKIDDVKGYVESDSDLYADLGRPNQASIRSKSCMDDVVAEFYLENDTAKCIFNVYDESCRPF